MKIIPIIKNSALFYCVIFTIGTLLNSYGVVWLGWASNPDVHGHIILRSGICLVITILVSFMAFIFKKGKMTTYVIGCLVTLLIIMIFIWCFSIGFPFGNADDIHPNAFRDLTRSIAAPYALLAIITGFVLAWRIKRKKD